MSERFKKLSDFVMDRFEILPLTQQNGGHTLLRNWCFCFLPRVIYSHFEPVQSNTQKVVWFFSVSNNFSFWKSIIINYIRLHFVSLAMILFGMKRQNDNTNNDTYFYYVTIIKQIFNCIYHEYKILLNRKNKYALLKDFSI